MSGGPKRHGSQAERERELERLQARRLEREFAPTIPIATVSGDGSGDGAPSEEMDEFGAITPPPFDPSDHPELAAVWQHADTNYRRASSKVMEAMAAAGASADVRKAVATHAIELRKIRLMVRVAQWIGGVLIAVVGTVTGLALDALYSTGEDKGSLRQTIHYMTRDIERNREAIEALATELRNALADHERDHRSSRGRNSAPAAPSLTPGDSQ